MYGTTLVDSTAARQHVEKLREAGVGRRTIAEMAGVAESVIARLIGIDRSRPANRVTPETAAAILAIDIDSSSPYVDATGARRRIQSLGAIGWSQTAIADRIGWTVSNLNGITLGMTTQIRRSTHDLIAAVYAQLSHVEGPSNRSRNHAAVQGWPKPAAWDDIDTDDYERAVVNTYGRTS